MIRLGTDIVYIPRFRQPLIVLAIALQRVYTLAEQCDWILGKTRPVAPVNQLAGRWAAKKLLPRHWERGAGRVATPILRLDASQWGASRPSPPAGDGSCGSLGRRSMAAEFES